MIIIIIIMIMIIIMLVITYITHNYYILIYYIITQRGHSPLHLARHPPFHVPEYRKQKVIEILEGEEKKSRK